MTTVVKPERLPKRKTFSRLRRHVAVVSPDPQKTLPADLKVQIPYFSLPSDHTTYVLAKDLATHWNFPSSYQVIARLLKRSGVERARLVHTTTPELNQELSDLIDASAQNKAHFYLDLQVLHQILENDLILFGEPPTEEEDSRVLPAPNEDDEPITISQVFPNYGQVDSSLPLTHGTFLSLNPLTKLQVYKHEGNYRRVFGTSMNAHERELIYQANSFALYDVSQDQPGTQIMPQKSKRPLGRLKRSVGNEDPNQLDVSESLLPGCGQIPEFNIGSICKVPNYFVTSNHMNTAQQNALYNPYMPHMRWLQLNYEPQNPDANKAVNQLLSSSHHEALPFKYYYYKSYRGPGLGNYKDAALVNRVNKICRFTPDSAPSSNSLTHLALYKVTKTPLSRGDKHIKGLMHEFFSGDNLDIVTERQRRFTEDFNNMEMLHNNVLFNLMVNSYRDISSDTWKQFFKFKSIDFEKLYSLAQTKRRNERRKALLKEQEEASKKSGVTEPPLAELLELLKPDLSLRFVTPDEHKEILEQLPLDMRGDESDALHALSKPIRYVATYPDKNTPEVLNQIEVVKLPNANSIAWDNIKKYRRP